MDYAFLGDTGLKVSRLGFGGAGFGNMYTPVDEAEAMRSVAMAVDECGITYFDAAPSYGPEGLSESRLGKALEGRRDRVVLTTKCGRYDHGVCGNPKFEFTLDPQRTRQELENSLRRLRTDYIDIYQLHDLSDGRLEYALNETIPELEKCVKEGKIRYIGVTGCHLNTLAQAAVRSESVSNILTYARYCLMNTTLEALREKLPKDRRIGVENSSVTFMGYITKEHTGIKGMWDSPEMQHMRVQVEKANAICAEYGADLGEVSVQFGLCCDHCADSTLISMARVKRLRQNMELYARRRDVSSELIQRLRETLDGASPY